MPVDWSKYPQNWKEISRSVKEEAVQRCEFCGVENYSVGYRHSDGHFEPVSGNILLDLAGQGLHYPSLERLSYKEAKEIADSLTEHEWDGIKYIVIVLTVAHLDHDTKHNERSNLRALCQRCHNRHDVNFRKQNRNKTLLLFP